MRVCVCVRVRGWGRVGVGEGWCRGGVSIVVSGVSAELGGVWMECVRESDRGVQIPTPTPTPTPTLVSVCECVCVCVCVCMRAFVHRHTQTPVTTGQTLCFPTYVCVFVCVCMFVHRHT